MTRFIAMWALVGFVGLVGIGLINESVACADTSVQGRLAPVLLEIQKTELADRYRDKAARVRLEAASVELGVWYRIGPFRDHPPLLNWMENTASSFEHTYQAEADLASDGSGPRWKMSYPAPNFPTTPDATRRWQKRPDWIDGYLCDLPRGPAPSAGETQYVYRTINAKEPITVTLEFSVRSPESDRRMNEPNMEHWRRQARYLCRLNGQEVLRYEGKSAVPVATPLELKAGVNHFLAKVTNNRHAYGFSFALVGLHPLPRRQGAHEQPWRPFRSYRMGDLPYHQATKTAPSIASAENWWDALFATIERDSKKRGKTKTVDTDRLPDLLIADFEGPDYGGWKSTGDAFGPGPAKGTIGGQMNVTGFQGKGLVNTYYLNDTSTGTLTSPPFPIERSRINFLIGGGGFEGKTCMNLLVDGKQIRTATGPNVVGGGHETLAWASWDVAKFIGKKAVIQIVDKRTGGWGHINVDQITQSQKQKAAIVTNREPRIWTALQQAFPDTRSRFEIELTRSIGTFWDRSREANNRAEAERILADRFLSQLAKMSGRSNEQLLDLLKVARDDPTYSATIRDAYFTACRYREALARLESFRHARTPMPGIEAAQRDSMGRIITPMEADLDRYPKSKMGRKHQTRVETLGREIQSLLEGLVESDTVQLDRTIRLNDQIESMWTDAIRNLPPIVFLERPSYRYDALQFTNNGASPSSIRVFDPIEKHVRTIFHSPNLRAHDMTLSWDARTIFLGGGGVVAEVGVDGTGYRVITDGQSPTELPDGRVIFFDDVEGISPCKGGGPRRVLFTTERDGSARKIVSANLTIDTTPQVSTDGRVLFCRWDYGVNKNVFNRHAIWVQNPDGTALDLFFGNTIIDPFAFYRPRQIPGRPEVMCIFGTHHNHNAGLVGLIWQGSGREAGDGVGFRRVTHDTASVGDACPHWAYQDPYPLNEQLFLVSYGGTSQSNVALYLLDRYGNKKCLFEPADKLGAYCPQPFVARERPPTIPSRTKNPDWQPVDLREQLLSDPDWSQKAVMTLQDVYCGIEPAIKRGRIKHLAVMEQVVHTTPRGGAIGVGTIFYVNRLIGLVPIEKDGSAHFEVPALRSLYFHVLDADGKMLMTMGSDMHAMPGEQRSCVGCHEGRKSMSTPTSGHSPLATHHPPKRPEMPKWGTNGILEYEAVVQPVLDKYCVKCHAGPKPDGRLDLSGSRTVVYNMSYMELVDKGLVHYVPGTGRTHAQPSADYDEQAPLSRGTLLSKITPYIEDPKHCGVNIPWDDRFRIYCWIDANVPYYSHYTQMSPTILNDTARGLLTDVYRRRCARCHDQRPRRDAIAWLSKYNTWVHSGERPGQWGISESGMRVRHLDLTHPSHSMALQAPLATDAGGLQLCKQDDGKPIFRDKNDPDYAKMLESLTNGVITRNQPGVFHLLDQRQAKTGAKKGDWLRAQHVSNPR